MSVKDGTIHVISLIGTMLLAGGLGVPTLYLTEAADADAAPGPDKMIAIEASLATKSTNKSKQPQKQFKAPEPVKPEPQQGVADDPNKVPTKKPEEPKKKPDKEKSLEEKMKELPSRPDDTDTPTGKPTDAAPFNPNAIGHGPANVGDPYFAKLTDDLIANFPGHNVSDNPPEACIHLTPEGKIADTKFNVRSNDDLQQFAEGQLKALVKERNEHPVPVPIQLIDITKQWLCFKFTVNK